MPKLYMIPAGLVEFVGILAIYAAVFNLKYWVRWRKGILFNTLLFLANEMIGLGLLRFNAK
jgi:hypothetical protein